MQTEQLQIDQLRREATITIASLSRKVSRGNSCGDGFGRVWTILEALPLATEEFCRLRNHLQNAEDYARADERGGARYELALLARSIG